ncbi:hypothetical protein EON65_31005 [archaeon]|nr:MAG: hypothetical protein EON65_31005 [archaeon]
MSYGFQNGGGIADNFVHSTGVRLILDLSFFVVVLVILLNVFLGMIIDTFSSLRADKLERMRDTTEVCFICGIDKQVFDRASTEPNGFRTHINIDHNMWNYLYFIFMLWEQDRDDDDGLEQYVRRAIDANEITWFPLHKAMRLTHVATKAEVLRKDLTESIKVKEESLTSKFEDFHADVSSMLYQLMSTLRQDSAAAGQSKTDGNSVASEDDDELNDNMSHFTESAYMADLVLGKHIQLGIARINGLELSDSEMLLVSCRLMTDSGLLAANAQRVEEGTIYFDETKRTQLFSNVQPHDRRSLLLQILNGDDSSGRVMQFLSVLEISVQDFLALGEGVQRLEKKFLRAEQPEVCSITIVCEVENAKGFGIRGSLSRANTFNSMPSQQSNRKTPGGSIGSR